MRSGTTLDYVTLAGTVIGNILRRHPFEAMTLRWETEVQWIDVKRKNRLGNSRWYSHWYQIKTSSCRCEGTFLTDPGALACWHVSTSIT